MENNQEAQQGSSNTTGKAQDENTNTDKTTASSSESRPSLYSRSSLESTATTLPPYTHHSIRPPKYSEASPYMYSGRPNPANQSKSPAKPRGQPFNAASVNAVMATSSSSTDKMHSKRGTLRRVDDWNEDTTYKSRLASMVGISSRRWNYYGADIGGNPFRRSGKR